MADRHTTSCIAEAFGRVLDILGEESKQALLWHLKHEYDIEATRIELSDVKKIEYALASLLGNDGAQVILKHLDVELQRRK